MNKLNNKFLLILLCVSNSGFGASFQPNASVPQNSRTSLVKSSTGSGLSSYSVTNIPWCRHKIKPNPMTIAHKEWLSGRLEVLVIGGNFDVARVILERAPQLASCTLSAVINQAGYKYNSIEFLLAHLVNYSASVDHKNDKGETPFFKAIQDSRFDVASIVLKAGADIDAADEKSNTPLHQAVRELGAEEIKFLLYHEADPNRPNKQGITPYQMAVHKGGVALQAFEKCIRVFSVINATVENNNCFTVMSLLAHNGRQLKNILRFNTTGHCSPDIAIAEKLLQQCGDEVWTELGNDYSSCSKDLLWLAQLIKERLRHREEFLKALGKNDFAMAQQLVQINPYILYTYDGESDCASDLLAEKLLSISASNADYRHIKELLHEGFDLNIRDDQGITLLCQLIMDIKDKTKYADLLKSGVNVNTVDMYGKTPLSYAVLLCNTPKVRKLLEYGAVVQSDMLTKKCPTSFSVWRLLSKAFKVQHCCVCERHPADMSNIPCINRHSGKFICKACYIWASECPLCKRSLEKYGA